MMHSVYFCYCCINDSDIAPTICVYRLFDLYIRSGFFMLLLLSQTLINMPKLLCTALSVEVVCCYEHKVA